MIGLIGLFLGKKDELLGLFPKILVENKFFDLNILHFLFITFLIIIVSMIFFRVTGQYLLEEIFEKSIIHDSNNKKFSDDEINNKNKDFENDENKLLN